MNSKIKFLLLDFGNVLIHVDWHRTIQKLNLSDEIFEKVRLSEEHDLYERDAISTDAFYAYINSVLPKAMTMHELNEAWCSVLADEVHGIDEFIKKHSTQFEIYILSNTNRAHIEYSLKKYKFLKNIKKILTSYDLQARKPEKNIYFEAAQDMGAEPSEVLFIDDREENVIGARECGFNAEVCYRSVARLEEIISDYK